jgi:diketogulonate reductase-like aldo/keto reductase
MTTLLGRSKTLNNGVAIPMLGLGVYEAGAGDETYQAVSMALEVGYRHIDTAKIYGNEADVGRAIAASALKRSELYIVTKVWNSDQGYDETLRACEQSLIKLGLEYLDLYLIHWPKSEQRKETWRALERLEREKMCRSIGVSNYTIPHLQELLLTANTVPAINQVEFHPFLYQQALLAFCQEQGIALEAYSPLVRGQRFGDARLQAIAKKHDASPAQILIAWCLAHDVIVIPKSTKRDRIVENAQAITLTLDADDMTALDALNENFRTCWDPTTMP